MSLRALAAWWRRTLAARTLARYGAARGGVLAGGMGFAGFFSLFPVLAVAFTVFGYVVGPNADLQRRVAERVDTALGVRLIGTAPGDGVVRIGDLVQGRVLTLTGVVGLLVLVIGGLGWLDAAREGIRAVAGLSRLPLGVRRRLRDLASAAVLGVTVLASVVAGVGVGVAAGAVLARLGLATTPGAGTVVTVVTGLVLALLDAVILAVLVRLLAGVRLEPGRLWPAALAGGVALEVLTLSGGLLLHRVSGNALLAASSVLAAVLVWMGLVARVTLLTAALAVTLSREHGREPVDAGAREDLGRPVDAGGPERTARMHQDGRSPEPTVGVRARDRVTLAAGMVLGAGVLVAARVFLGGLRTLRALLRGPREETGADG